MKAVAPNRSHLLFNSKCSPRLGIALPKLPLLTKKWSCPEKIPSNICVVRPDVAYDKLIVFRLTLKLLKPMVVEQGQRFTLRDGTITLGTGVITKINARLTEDERTSLVEGKKAREKAATKTTGKK